MIESLAQFLSALSRLPLGWRTWVGGLVLLNLAVPLFFFRRREAKIVIAVFLTQGTCMWSLFWAQGFTRLLGLAHFGWFWLLYRLWTGPLPASESATPWGLWLRAVFAADALSLCIDVVDIIRYLLGERSVLM